MRGEELNEFEQVHGLETARRIFLDQAHRNKNIVVIDATRSMKEVLADCIMYFKKAAVQKIAASAVRQLGMVQPDHVNMVLGCVLKMGREALSQRAREECPE